MLILPLCKESFTLVVPAVLFMYLWLYSVRTNLGICNSFKQNKLLVIVPLLYMTACIAFIILRVGTSKIVYAGVNESMFSTKIILISLPLFSHTKFLSHTAWYLNNSYQRISYAGNSRLQKFFKNSSDISLTCLFCLRL